MAKAYAIDWTYGRATDMRTGDRCGRYYAFDSRKDRDQWVSESPTEYTTQSGYREAITASDPELRRYIRRELSGQHDRNSQVADAYGVWSPNPIPAEAW